MHECRDCGVSLSDANWFPSLRKVGNRLCRTCSNLRAQRWKKANPSANKALERKYSAKYAERRRAYTRTYNASHREQVRARSAEHRAQLRAEALAAYGGACACCTESHPHFLAIDHIDNDGAQHRRELKSRAMAHLYRLLKKLGYPKDRFRLLCHNCNNARALYGICPHQESMTSVVYR